MRIENWLGHYCADRVHSRGLAQYGYTFGFMYHYDDMIVDFVIRFASQYYVTRRQGQFMHEACDLFNN
jgi:hypothetical protein